MPPKKTASPDDFQTPPQAVAPLLPYLKKDWVIWECAAGKGYIADYLKKQGYKVISTDIKDGKDFLTNQPKKFDCIITNPPYSLKQEFLQRAFELGKPFAFLLPITTLEGKKRQQLFDRHGIEILIPDSRIHFETPNKTAKSNSWFASAWFTHGLKIGKQISFYSVKEKKGLNGPGTKKTRNQREVNQIIEAFIKTKDANKDTYTEEEKKELTLYSGSGGLASQGAEAGEGLLYEYYTPEWLCEQLWKLANHYGYDGGAVLEPSVATGNLIKNAPDYSKCVGFEINPTSARICEILYPGCKVYQGYFEGAFLSPPRFTERVKGKPTWLSQYPFSLVIGNPPYGIYRNRFSSYFDRKLFKQIEIFFIYQGLQMLKPGGLLVYLVSQNFLRTGDKYNYAKEQIGKIADIVDAYRLPKVFKYSDVPTDILVLKKK